VLTRVGGTTHARAEMAEISDTLAREERSLGLLFKPGVRVALLIGIVLAVLQQVTGINIVLYFAPTIFEAAGLDTGRAIGTTVYVGLINMTFTVVAIWLVDRLGRKPLLMAASAGMGISLALLGAAFATGRSNGAWVLVPVLAYVACFAVAMGPVVWVVLSEIFPTKVRGTAMAVATVCLWASCFLVTQSFPWMLTHLAGYTFFVYAVMCAVAFVFTAVAIPETKGKSLEEIERRWSRG
jgi:MFS family permease